MSRDLQSSSYTLTGDATQEAHREKLRMPLLVIAMNDSISQKPPRPPPPTPSPVQPASERQHFPSLLLVPHSLQCQALSQGVCLSTISCLPACATPLGLRATSTPFLFPRSFPVYCLSNPSHPISEQVTLPLGRQISLLDVDGKTVKKITDHGWMERLTDMVEKRRLDTKGRLL